MLTLFFRYFFVIICCYIFYVSILKKDIQVTSSICDFLFKLLLVFSASYSTLILFPDIPSFRILYICTITFLLLTIIYNVKVLYSLSLTLIAFQLSYLALFLSCSIVSIFLLFFPNTPTYKFSPYTYFSIGIIQFLISYHITKNERFTNGILYITKNRKGRCSIFLSSLCLFYIICESNRSTHISNITKICAISFFLILSIILIIYYKQRITQTYLENMRRLEILNYENTIADKDKHIKELEENNAHLGRIIHKYRKTIPAIELSVMELLQNNEGLDTAELKCKAKSLQIQLDEIHAERDSLFDNFQKQTIASTQTGLHTVDAMLALMEKRAKQDWIRYKMQIAPDIKELSLNSIKETDLLHLLGDLIENAIHAVNVTYTKDILIHIGKLNNCLLFEISDSGVPFDIPTYQNFGNEAYTSYKEDGGTGTGLMDIWSIKKKYKASLYIYEYESSSNNIYTKKISFLFDGKNHFLLKTYRDKEIKNFLIRGDLHVFPHEAE